MLTNGGVVDVVVGGNHSEVEGGKVHLILNSYALEEGKEVRKRERSGWREAKGKEIEEGRERGLEKREHFASEETLQPFSWWPHLGLLQICECILYQL